MRSRHRSTIRAVPAALLIGVLTGCIARLDERPAPVQPAPATEVVDGRFTTADGVEIAYDLRGSGDTALVFVHCWACNRSFWRHQIEAFTDRYRVLALDLPGHGASGSDRDRWTLAGLGDDVAALVAELGLERVILVGHSMGGPVALLAAPRLAGRVAGVACVDTLHDVELPWDAEALAPIVGMYGAGFADANRQFVPMMFPEGADPATIDWVVENANRTAPDAALALMSDFPSLDFRQLLTGAGVPIRCVNAAPLGQMIPPTAVESNGRYADFDAVILEGVGHYLMLEKPDEFNRLLAAAVAELDTSG